MPQYYHKVFSVHRTGTTLIQRKKKFDDNPPQYPIELDSGTQNTRLGIQILESIKTPLKAYTIFVYNVVNKNAFRYKNFV